MTDATASSRGAGGGDAAADDAAARAAPWLAEGLTLFRTRDRIGPGDRRGLLRLLDDVDARVPFGLPWCGIFVAHCLQAALPAIEPPPRHARARPWLDWGREVAPQLGCLLVFWRLHPRLPFGHVGFYLREDGSAFHVLGGNQRDRIRVQRYPKTRLLGARWPEGVAETHTRRTAPPHQAAPPE